MKKIVYLFVLFSLPVLVSTADKASKNQVDDIREAVFRWQFEHNASRQQGTAQAYFLEVGERSGDPSDAFLKRFADNKPPVGKASECRKSTRGVFGKSGERGLIFRVERIDWKSDTQVEVEGGYNEDGMSASGNTYTVQKTKARWKVTNDKMHWIS